MQPVPLKVLSSELNETIRKAELWLAEVSQSVENLGSDEKARLDADRQLLLKLRRRASSSLLNIAMFGAYSSGKSLLVSGIQRRLSARKVVRADGRVAERYIGLLPSAPTPTTCCPASVVPELVDAEEGDKTALRVRFVDSGEWEDIAESPSSVLVASYAMDDPAYIDARRDQDFDRLVAEIELAISPTALPVKLYDLPGYGSLNKTHEQVVRLAVDDADYLIYVTSASRTLSPEDLNLIRFLYAHFKSRGKKVIWVVTGIDRADELGMDNRYAWESTIDKNNQYLEENFRDKAFIGNGFIGVSAVAEAKGLRALEHGDNEEGQALRISSQMDALRGELEQIVKSETGLPHLRVVGAEAYDVIYPYQRRLTDLLLAEQLPIESLEKERGALKHQIASLHAAVPELQANLELALSRHLTAVKPLFGGLQKKLHDELDREIDKTDPTNDKKFNNLEMQRIRITQEWVSMPDGPNETWQSEEAKYRQYVKDVLSQKLGAASLSVQLLPAPAVELDRLFAPRRPASRTETQDILQKAAGVLTLMTGSVAAAGALFGGLTTSATATAATAAAATAATATTTVVTGGVAIVAAIAYSAIVLQKRRGTALEAHRAEYKAALNRAADEDRDAFVAAAAVSGATTISRAMELLTEEMRNLTAQVGVVEERIRDPENLRRRNTVTTLAPLVELGKELLGALRINA